MRVGIFGGTFNPIHLGHLRSAEEVSEGENLDRVLFIPSATPPHKRLTGLAPADHRLAMVKLAIAGNPRFRVSTVEIDRDGRSYSVDTVRELRRRMPRTYFSLILGLDAFREIGTWKQYAELFTLCDIVVTSRPPYTQQELQGAIPVAARREFCYQQKSEALIHRTGTRITFFRLTDLAISASDVRQRVLGGLSVRYLVTPSVERYIARHRLYARRVGSH